MLRHACGDDVLVTVLKVFMRNPLINTLRGKLKTLSTQHRSGINQIVLQQSAGIDNIKRAFAGSNVITVQKVLSCDIADNYRS